ncbi:hypothetical protein QJS04_geneDACA006295 [Acorus gramineus]|uniref:Uncharacterized protein n=1 Tax=Acorus gramineus TaxID=55184 RepID=A0AAV9B0C9_ACOGR|nr:hypothetical protein QJS04_geneDACA006295 [Acorus gramineus]
MAPRKVGTTTTPWTLIVSIVVISALLSTQLVHSRAPIHSLGIDGDRSGVSSLKTMIPNRVSVSMRSHGGDQDFLSLARLASGQNKKGKGH